MRVGDEVDVVYPDDTYRGEVLKVDDHYLVRVFSNLSPDCFVDVKFYRSGNALDSHATLREKLS